MARFKIGWGLIPGGDDRPTSAGRAESPRDRLLAEVVHRQPVLAAINLVTALLLAAGLADVVPAGLLAAWVGYMVLVQGGRVLWWLGVRRRGENGAAPSRAFGVTLGAAATGAGWGFTGVAFAGAGSPTEQVLVPFFLAGMSAGAAATVSGYLPALLAFLLPALLPYAVALTLSGQPAATVMALATLVYAAALGVLAWQAHRAAWRAVDLYLENGRLLVDLDAARRRLERRVERRGAELETILDTVPVAIWIAHDPGGRRITGSRHANAMLRLPAGSNASLTAPTGERPAHFRLLRQGAPVPPDGLPIQRAARGETVRDEEYRIQFADGTFIDELISASPVRAPGGAILGAVGAAVDITHLKRTEEALRLSEQRFRDFAEAASDWFWETDAEDRFVWLSPNVETLTGVSPDWLRGKTRLELVAPGTDPAMIEAYQSAVAARRPFRDIEFLRRGPAADVWVSVSGVPVFDGEGRFTGYRGVGRDISEKKHAEERIRHLALHDELTGLPNRHLLQDRLRQALRLAERGGHGVAVLLLDLDRFKDVNDTFGHPAGDQLLRLAAARLAATVRASDTLARLGGDEFAVVQPALEGADAAAVLADRLLAALAEPFLLDEQEIHVGASVGIALHPGDGSSVDELVRRADLALYRAKHQGGSRFAFFEAAMDNEVRSRQGLESELRRALDRGEFVLHYQPQVELARGRVVGVEALVRWRHPERGLVPPGEFIPLAEASGLILRLGAWVLDEACRQARVWRETGFAPKIAVNLSPAQLRQGGVLQAIDAAVRRHRVDPRQLELEITESLLLERSEGSTDRSLQGLATRGIGLALDDFGIGYSSLAYLKRLPARKIKIDRSFVRGIGTDPDDEALVRAIVTLARALGKKVVAEGVETDAQLAFLRRLGCDAAQGFLLGPPQDAATFGAARRGVPFLAASEETFAVDALVPP